MSFIAALVALSANAAVVTFPDSALTPSNQYYTDIIGGGLGSPLVMTGGGNDANIGGTRNDDGFSGPIDLGFSVDFFGTTYSQFWANNNGNISFTGGISAFTPTGPQGASSPIISPFFADVDTRNPLSGLMYLRNDIPDQIIVTWDQVGYFNQNVDLLNSFQLVFRGPDFNVPFGEGNIGFFWRDMQWETGDASEGTGGFGGTPGAVGFGNGAGDGVILESSLTDGISQIVSNHNIWFNPNLEPIPPSGPNQEPIPPSDMELPEPPLLGLLAIGMLGMGFKHRRTLRAG